MSASIQRHEIAVDAAEVARRVAWAEYRAAHDRFFAADIALFHARLDLADAIAEEAFTRPPTNRER